MPEAILRISSSQPSLLFESIAPEVGREIPRTRVEAEQEEDGLMLNINADDLSALRAALNSYLIWIRIIEDVVDYAGR